MPAIPFHDVLARSKRPPIGTFITTPAAAYVEIAKSVGFDFIVIDTEHALMGAVELDNLLVLSRALELTALVRVADHGYADVQRILDAGAMGIFVPHVSDPEDAAKVVAEMIHPPIGVRGSHAGMRAGGFGVDAEQRARYTDHEAIWRVAMIEDAGAVSAIDEILSTPNLSSVFIGPGDLSMSMGRSPGDEAVQQAVARVRDHAKARGVPVATVASDADGVRRLVDEGYDWIVANYDIGLFASVCRAILAGANEPIA